MVHGIPTNRILLEGDIISIDCSAILNGYHGIGKSMHEVPEVLNYGVPSRGSKLVKGMVLAI